VYRKYFDPAVIVMKVLAEIFSINGEEADGQNREGPLLTSMHRKSICVAAV
jgi:hypothetical protein